MILERRKWLKWVRYADCNELSLDFLAVYRAAFCGKYMFGFKRAAIKVMHINLEMNLDYIFQQFHPELRRQIRKARKENLMLWEDQDYQDVLNLFSMTAKAKGLRGVSTNLLSTKSNFLVTHVSDKQRGVVAAHYYSLDLTRGIAFLDYNCSAFRKYSLKQDRRRVALANKLLFWYDIKYFKKEGYKILDLGECDPEQESDQIKGVYGFKLPFNGDIRMLYSYTPYWLLVVKKLRAALRFS